MIQLNSIWNKSLWRRKKNPYRKLKMRKKLNIQIKCKRSVQYWVIKWRLSNITKDTYKRIDIPLFQLQQHTWDSRLPVVLEQYCTSIVLLIQLSSFIFFILKHIFKNQIGSKYVLLRNTKSKQQSLTSVQSVWMKSRLAKTRLY